jgi:hypothetical protein
MGIRSGVAGWAGSGVGRGLNVKLVVESVQRREQRLEGVVDDDVKT